MTVVDAIEERQRLLAAPERVGSPTPSDGADVFYVGAWVNDGVPFDKAVELAQDPLTIFVALIRQNGLELILADKYMIAGLRRGLIEGHGLVLTGLEIYASARKPKAKPGPKRKGGKYRYESIIALDAHGKTDSEIAELVFNDRTKRRVVAAHLSETRKKQRDRQQ